MKGIWDPLLGSAIAVAEVGMDLCALGSPSNAPFPLPILLLQEVLWDAEGGL